MENFGIYRILEALARMNGARSPSASPSDPPRDGAERDSRPAESDAAPPPAENRPAPPPETYAPSFFNARMAEIIERHEAISRRIDRREGTNAPPRGGGGSGGAQSGRVRNGRPDSPDRTRRT